MIWLCEETVAKVIAKYHKWKAAMETNGLKVSVKTEGMTSQASTSIATVAAIEPCGVSKKRVGVN